MKKLNQDNLTGLIIKSEIVTILEEEIKSSEKTKKRFSIALTDIDFFKKVNDDFGHLAGDQIIKEFASIINKNCRDRGIVGRFGAEEFLIIFPSTEKEEALILMEDIRRLISSKLFSITTQNDDKKEIKVTFSTGIACFPKDGKDKTSILRNTDNALLMAKKYGRDRVCLAVEEKMVLKSNYYTKAQLDRLNRISKEMDLTESTILREGLDYIIDKYEQKLQKRINNDKSGKKSLNFSELKNLPNKSIQIILKNIDSETLLYSMVDADKNILEVFFKNMSERAKELFNKDIENLKKNNISADELSKAQIKVGDLMTSLWKEGEI